MQSIQLIRRSRTLLMCIWLTSFGTASGVPEDDAWAKARAQGSAEAIASFIAQYPGSRYAEDAKESLRRARFAFAMNSNNTRALQLYIKLYPTGRDTDAAIRVLSGRRVEQQMERQGETTFGNAPARVESRGLPVEPWVIVLVALAGVVAYTFYRIHTASSDSHSTSIDQSQHRLESERAVQVPESLPIPTSQAERSEHLNLKTQIVNYTFITSIWPKSQRNQVILAFVGIAVCFGLYLLLFETGIIGLSKATVAEIAKVRLANVDKAFVEDVAVQTCKRVGDSGDAPNPRNTRYVECIIEVKYWKRYDRVPVLFLLYEEHGKWIVLFHK